MTTPPTPPAIQALIFDFDGLIVDSEPLAFMTGLALLKQHGCEREWEPEVLERFLGRRMSEIMPEIAEICGLTVPVEELLVAFEDLRLITLRDQLRVFPGATALIAFGRSIGLRVALATSGRRPYVDAALAEVGLTGCFEIRVTGEDVTQGKPAPDVYLLAASRLGVAPDRCVVFERCPHRDRRGRRGRDAGDRGAERFEPRNGFWSAAGNHLDRSARGYPLVAGTAVEVPR